MLRLLLQLGADPNRPDGEGMTALHTAMLAQNVELMRILLEDGAVPIEPWRNPIRLGRVRLPLQHLG